MADKIAEKAPEKAKKEKKKNGFWKKVSHFFKDFRSEVKKIVWPTKKQVVNNTIVVFVAMGVDRDHRLCAWRTKGIVLGTLNFSETHCIERFNLSEV